MMEPVDASIFPNRFDITFGFDRSVGIVSLLGEFENNFGLGQARWVHSNGPSGELHCEFQGKTRSGSEFRTVIGLDGLRVSAESNDWEQLCDLLSEQVHFLAVRCDARQIRLPREQLVQVRECVHLLLPPREDRILPLDGLLKIKLQGAAEVTGLPILGMRWSTTYVIESPRGRLKVLAEHHPPDEYGIERLTLDFICSLPADSASNFRACLSLAHQHILNAMRAALTQEALRAITTADEAPEPEDGDES